jgi:hypothetical protein
MLLGAKLGWTMTEVLIQSKARNMRLNTPGRTTGTATGKVLSEHFRFENRRTDALILAETMLKLEPNNEQIKGLVENLKNSNSQGPLGR